MTPEDDDNVLDNLFHACAFRAWLQQAAEQQDWPDFEAVRERAYRLYEEARAAKNAAKG